MVYHDPALIILQTEYAGFKCPDYYQGPVFSYTRVLHPANRNVDKGAKGDHDTET